MAIDTIEITQHNFTAPEVGVTNAWPEEMNAYDEMLLHVDALRTLDAPLGRRLALAANVLNTYGRDYNLEPNVEFPNFNATCTIDGQAVNIGLMESRLSYHVGVVVLPVNGQREGQRATLNINKQSGELVMRLGNLPLDRTMALLDRGLPDMVLATIEQANPHYLAAQEVCREVLDAAEVEVGINGQKNSYRRRAVIQFSDSRLRHAIEDTGTIDAAGRLHPVPALSVRVEGLGAGPAMFALYPRAVREIEPHTAWREPGVESIDDVFYVFCDELLRASKLLAKSNKAVE
jgi:hypothetical protein